MIGFKHIKNAFSFLISLKFRSGLQLISGFYAEWSKRKDLIIAEKIYCTIFHLITMLLFFGKYIYGFYFDSGAMAAFPTIFEYFCWVLLTFFSKGLNCCRFYSDLRTIDKTMGVKIPRTAIIASSFLLMLFTVYLVLVSIFDGAALNEQMLGLSIMIWFVFLHQTQNIVFFEMFWKRMRVIRLQLSSEMNSSDTNGKIRSITKWLLVYKNLLVSLERIMGSIKLSIIFAIILATGQNFLHIFSVITMLKGYNTNLTLQVLALGTIIRLTATISVFAPALLAEMALYEYEEIKGLLATNLLYCSATDGELRSVIHKSLDYLDSRVPRYNIWRIFQLDISLPITFFNLYITFLILVLQYKG